MNVTFFWLIVVLKEIVACITDADKRYGYNFISSTSNSPTERFTARDSEFKNLVINTKTAALWGVKIPLMLQLWV